MLFSIRAIGPRCSVCSLAALLGLVAYAAGPAAAPPPGSTDADTAAHLRLSERVLAQYIAAGQHLLVVKKTDPASFEKLGEARDDASIDEIAATIDTAPAAKQAIASAGLSNRQYVLTSLAVLEAMLAAEYIKHHQPVPKDISTVNVPLVRKHASEIAELIDKLQSQ